MAKENRKAAHDFSFSFYRGLATGLMLVFGIPTTHLAFYFHQIAIEKVNAPETSTITSICGLVQLGVIIATGLLYRRNANGASTPVSRHPQEIRGLLTRIVKTPLPEFPGCYKFKRVEVNRDFSILLATSLALSSSELLIINLLPSSSFVGVLKQACIALLYVPGLFVLIDELLLGLRLSPSHTEMREAMAKLSTEQLIELKLSTRRDAPSVNRVLQQRIKADESAKRAFRNREYLSYKPLTSNQYHLLETPIWNQLSPKKTLLGFFVATFVLSGVWFLSAFVRNLSGIEPKVPNDSLGVFLVCEVMIIAMIYLLSATNKELTRSRFKSALARMEDEQIREALVLLGPSGRKVAERELVRREQEKQKSLSKS